MSYINDAPISKHYLQIISKNNITIDDEDTEYYNIGDPYSDNYACVVEYIIDNPGHFFDAFTGIEIINVSDIKANKIF